jgi:hypothetical protein
MAYALADFRAPREELRRRTNVIRGLPSDVCPQNKVTPELATNKSLRLHPIVIGVPANGTTTDFEHLNSKTPGSENRFRPGVSSLERATVIETA